MTWLGCNQGVAADNLATPGQQGCQHQSYVSMHLGRILLLIEASVSKSVCLQDTSDRPLSESRRIKIWRAGKVDRVVVLHCYTPRAQIKDFNWAPCPSRFLSSKPLISDGLNAASAGPVASILSPQASMTHVGFFFLSFKSDLLVVSAWMCMCAGARERHQKMCQICSRKPGRR